uniref:Tetratricopeptide repeat protein 4 n=1 Tax=Caligus clemensi TaxID=344056 RepID=C1C1J5_CALCM|nr:Tetratricopeptide repeat protein 4 [Caligus clemensi]
MDIKGLREQMANMDESQRRVFLEKMDRELDQYIDGLESNSSRYVDGWYEDSWEKEMEDHPFFATSASQKDSEMSPLMQGIQDLKYSPEENSPEELAINYKEDGNYGFRFKKYRIAICAYSEGLKYSKELPELRATLLNNRASAHFYLGNYRSSLMDARLAVKTDPSHLKALIRGAKCASELSRYEESMEFCDKVLSLFPGHEEIRALRSKVLTKKSEKERNERKKALHLKKEKTDFDSLMKEIKTRGIQLSFSKRKDPEDCSLEDLVPVHPYAPQAQRVHLREGSLIWPLIFVYPEFHQSDFIQEFSEEDLFRDHINAVFDPQAEPPPWDSQNHYLPSEVQAFFKVAERDSIVKIETGKQSLKDVLCDKRFCVVDGLPEIIILSRKSEFYMEYIKKVYK